MLDEDRALQLIYSAVDEVNGQLPPAARLQKHRDTVLFGDGSALDSLAFVNLLVAVEGEVERERLEIIEHFHRALQAYRGQDWDMAERQFSSLARIESESRLCRTFLERIAILRQQPPGPGWDGAFTFETK